MDCFGQFRDECAGRCEFAPSCSYVTSSPDPDTAREVRWQVGFEANAWRAPVEPAQEQEDEEKTSERLGEVMRYLLGLDVLTLALLERVIVNPDCTQTEIARSMGTSRQNVHAAIVRACRKNPELKGVFVLLARRMTLAKERYPKDSSEAAATSERPPER